MWSFGPFTLLRNVKTAKLNLRNEDRVFPWATWGKKAPGLILLERKTLKTKLFGRYFHFKIKCCGNVLCLLKKYCFCFIQVQRPTTILASLSPACMWTGLKSVRRCMTFRTRRSRLCSRRPLVAASRLSLWKRLGRHKSPPLTKLWWEGAAGAGATPARTWTPSTTTTTAAVEAQPPQLWKSWNEGVSILKITCPECWTWNANTLPKTGENRTFQR